MAKVSIIIPSRNEVYTTADGENVLLRTLRDISEKAKGDYEVLVGFDGPPYQDLSKFPNVIAVEFPRWIGIKNTINNLAIMAEGEYLFKLDSHCSVGEGFDEILKADMEDNWLVMPRFYVLNGQDWTWQQRHGQGEFYDYFFLCCPLTDSRGFRFKAGGHWKARTNERLDIEIDETPQFHGSGWFVNKDFFLNKIGGFPVKDPFGHAQEPPNLGLKTWLGPWGGKVMVNKKTWYAHLHQNKYKKGFQLGNANEERTYRIIAEYWMSNAWEERAHDIEWFVEKFWPLPTWPENWKELLGNWRKDRKK